MTIDKEARSKADDALVVANKAKKGIKDRQVKNISVASQSAMLALTDVSPGQIVIREDDGYYNYLLKSLPASNLSNWQPMGKDAPPIGETVEDIITTNEVITSKADGLYAFTGTPNGGFPAGVTQGDIAQKTGSVWTVVYTFINAPASIYAKSDGQTYDKKVNSSNVNNWVAKPKPAYYEIGSNKEFPIINNSFAQFITDVVSVGVGQLYDSEFNQRVIFPANAQNFLLKGEGYVTRNNNIVNNIEILGHRFTLQKCQPTCDVSLANVSKTVTTTLNSKTIVITGAGQTTSGLVKYQKITGTGIPAMSYIDTIIDSTTFTISQNATANGTNITTTIQPKAPVVIDSSGTITEAGQPNIKRGKHCFDDISFSTPGASALDIFDIGHFADFRNCNFANKEINLYTTSTTPVYITFTNCQAGVINIYSPFIVVTKAYSPSVVFQTIISQTGIVDFDKATPVAYSLLRQYSLGQTVRVPLGAMIINDDVGGTLQTLKCTTAYTIPVTINTGTPIDLTKYQTGGGGGSLTITYQANSTTFPANPRTGDKVYVTSDGTSAGIIEEQWEYNGTDWILIEGVYPVSGAVVDNTIGDSALITTPGRYIVPATGLLNEFVGQANKYADYDGSIFSFIAPTNNDTVQINSGQNVGTVWKFTTAGGWAKVTSTATTVLGALKTPLFGNLIANYAEDNKGLTHALDVAIQNKVIQQLKNGTIFDLTPGGVQGQAMGISVNWFGRTIYKFADNTNAFPNANYNALIVNVPAGVRSVFLQVNNDVNGGHLCVRADYLDANNAQEEHLGYFVQQKDKQQFVRPFANNFRNNAGFHTWLMIPVHKAGKLAISLATVLSQADLWVGAIAFSDNAHNFMYEPALSYHWVVNKQNDLTTSAQFGGNNNIIWYNANPWTDGANIVRATLQFPIAQRAWARVRVVKPSDGQDIILHYTSWDKSSALPEVWRIRKRDGTYVTVASGSQASPNFDVQSSLWTHQLASVSASISTYIQSYHLKIPFAIWKDCIQVPTIDSPKLDFLNQGANLTITNAQANANQCFHISFTATGRAVTIQAPTNATRFYTVYNRGANAFTFAGINIPANSFVNLLYNSTTATWSVPTQQECFLDFEFWSYAVGDRYFLHIATSSSSIF